MRKRSQSKLILILSVTFILFVFSFVNIQKANNYKNKNQSLNNNLKILKTENKKLSSEKEELDKKHKTIKNKVSTLKGV